MKLYTEKQVKEICKYFDFPIKVINEILKITPIELPSDEEIEKHIPYGHYGKLWLAGAKWVIEHIKKSGYTLINYK